ncbi:hypothetical protein MYCTH_109232 [Thermothelomyces thermophilus ATCC 42464]|uniref:Chromo domain-containing protein n=1 Tax=Thermothelomyces thermophilus (strain ATCC 42464 / BCRC 31852 / DSM 1799) TaxID=573729 RepID=G2QPR3_THET4|nr:uncharacterized protein MYCTH_109232 [Thermothelomyces thermophilus ATCC 42464]AEO61576.1 hypothetical protein MYCTH_109232 [Thermothelomyces thermophilus ATCC 42464]
MFQVNPKASFRPAASDKDDSDDSISVTSTVSLHDPDQEYVVEAILAERQHTNGTMYYLIKWEDYPLHESTWEPESNLGPELKALWEEEKAKHATGELEPFDIRIFEEAQKQARKEKLERHHRRNRKRKRLGLPLTSPFNTDSSDEEAEEESGIETSGADEPVKEALRQSQQRARKRAPSPKPASVSAAGPLIGSSRRLSEGGRPSSVVWEAQTDLSSAVPERRQPVPSRTGYQGSSNKSASTATPDTAPKSNGRPAIALATTTAPPPRPSGTSSRKTFTAKKSAAQPTGNIFTSGKTRKPRASLKDSMSDPTKDPKLFRKHRQRWQAYKRSRDKEDLPPLDVSRLELYDLRRTQSLSAQSPGGFAMSPARVLPSQQENDHGPPLGHSQALTATIDDPMPAVPGAEAAHQKKKRKSVRFQVSDDSENLYAFVQESEQADHDSPVAQGRSKPSPLPCQLQEPGSDGSAPVPDSQDSDKTLVLGKLLVEATFTGLPRESSSELSWLPDFLARKTLDFSHTCFSGNAAAKFNSLLKDRLASGTITSKDTDQAIIARVADNLTVRLLALYYGQTEYNVLVYPTKCDEWKSILSGLVPAGPSEAMLGYLIFASPEDCRRMLPSPIPSLQFQSQIIEQPRPNAGVQNGLSARELLLKRLFDFDYNKLLPTVLLERPLAEHYFFLAIPKTRKEIEYTLCHWLRARNPKCQIFTSQQSGGWDAFRSVVETIPGVVIIHEMLAWSLRRFPNLARYLVSRNDEYWCISEPVDGLPLYPSISVAQCPAPPGDVRLTRLFPYRTVFLLTPSFLVSEPRRSLEFFEWFTSQWVGKFAYRLVTAYNIHEYLSELAEDKYRAREEMLKCPGNTQPDIEANLRGLTRDDCSCRYAVANMAADLHLTRLLHAGAEAQDEDNSSLIYADPSIDPNDEQSLVNWFGWWATLRADQFRKFHVIGSSQSMKLHGCGRGERFVRIPKYSKVTLNDPDAVLEVVQEMNDQADTAKASTHNHDESSLQMPSDRVSRPRFRDGPWSFRSNLIRTEDSECFADYLSSLTRLPGGKSLWGLYKFPVSWFDLEMATHFGDFSARYSRIHDWFKFTFPFGRSATDSAAQKWGEKYNTYVGFFYTIIDREWDYPDVVPPQKPLERHPWIAVYRPVNPHRTPYTRCEVIIWDPAARTRYPNGQAPAEKDLIFMQRQLIQHVRYHCDEKNHGTWLDQARGWKRVALGPPFDPSPEPSRQQSDSRSFPSDNTSDTDSSSLFVDQHHHQTNDEHFAMDLADVRPSISGNGGKANSEEGEDAEIDLAEYDDEQIRVIFHPPRGNNHSQSRLRNACSSRGAPPFRSRCINRLYEEARLARARNGGGGGGGDGDEGVTHMRYTFVPTLDWYREQQAEGRGFAHVNVDSWEGIFGLLKIGNGGSKGKGAGGGSATATATATASGGGGKSSSRGDAGVDGASTRTRGGADSGWESAGSG